jgi:murein DD-endopeptidase MepM/ murein hydrolase activator NlpD
LLNRITHSVDTLLQAALSIVQRHPKRITAIVASVLLGGTGATFAIASFAPANADIPVRTIVETVQPLAFEPQSEVLAQALTLYRSDITKSNDTAESLLKRLGVFDPAAATFLRTDTLTQQTLMGRYGRNVTVETVNGNALTKLTARWSPEDDGMFKRLTIEKVGGSFQSRIETLPMSASTRLAGGTIPSSLFAATDASRIPDAIAVQMAEIFSGDIDFHRALRKGDQFSVVYETLEGDGEPLRAGRVLSAEFVNAGKTHQAMWFQAPAASGAVAASTATHTLTKGGYYTLAGESLRRAFLASPMEFSRVTSGFSMRFHPILKTWRAHLGTDYGAPTGTPVRTVGDGVVDFAGVQNGFGNVVKVRHSNGSMTLYAHLSRINVRKGQNVSQGQNVGAVGATGWATGPHLHFEFLINGQHKDPQMVARLSPSVPVATALKPMFEVAAVGVRQQLAAAAQIQSASAQ